jgi:mannose-1-phosphate guanylyltransferase
VRITSFNLKRLHQLTRLRISRSAVPANALILDSYKTPNSSLLSNGTDALLFKPVNGEGAKKGPEILEPCFIDETAQLDPTAKIGPNVSIGAGVKVGFGVRIRDAIVLDNTTLEVSLFHRFPARSKC